MTKGLFIVVTSFPGVAGSVEKWYMLAERCGFRGQEIMFSSNNTLAEEYRMADRLGAIINLDDLTHVDFLEEAIGQVEHPGH